MMCSLFQNVYHDMICIYVYVYAIYIFQRLIYEGSPYTHLVWLRGQPGRVPQGAVIGSHTLDGAPLYVIKGKGVVGCHDAREEYAEYEAYGAKQTTEIEYLVLIFRESLFMQSISVNIS